MAVGGIDGAPKPIAKTGVQETTTNTNTQTVLPPEPLPTLVPSWAAKIQIGRQPLPPGYTPPPEAKVVAQPIDASTPTPQAISIASGALDKLESELKGLKPEQLQDLQAKLSTPMGPTDTLEKREKRLDKHLRPAFEQALQAQAALDSLKGLASKDGQPHPAMNVLSLTDFGGGKRWENALAMTGRTLDRAKVETQPAETAPAPVAAPAPDPAAGAPLPIDRSGFHPNLGLKNPFAPDPKLKDPLLPDFKLKTPDFKIDYGQLRGDRAKDPDPLKEMNLKRLDAEGMMHGLSKDDIAFLTKAATDGKLVMGSRGEDVGRLQKLLGKLDIPCGKHGAKGDGIDQIFGKDTKASLDAFRGNFHLTPPANNDAGPAAPKRAATAGATHGPAGTTKQGEPPKTAATQTAPALDLADPSVAKLVERAKTLDPATQALLGEKLEFFATHDAHGTEGAGDGTAQRNLLELFAGQGSPWLDSANKPNAAQTTALMTALTGNPDDTQFPAFLKQLNANPQFQSADNNTRNFALSQLAKDPGNAAYREAISRALGQPRSSAELRTLLSDGPLFAMSHASGPDKTAQQDRTIALALKYTPEVAAAAADPRTAETVNKWIDGGTFKGLAPAAMNTYVGLLQKVDPADIEGQKAMASIASTYAFYSSSLPGLPDHLAAALKGADRATVLQQLDAALKAPGGQGPINGLIRLNQSLTPAAPPPPPKTPEQIEAERQRIIRNSDRMPGMM